MSKWDYLDEEYENLPKFQKLLKSNDDLGRPKTDLAVGGLNRKYRAERRLKELVRQVAESD